MKISMLKSINKSSFLVLIGTLILSLNSCGLVLNVREQGNSKSWVVAGKETGKRGSSLQKEILQNPEKIQSIAANQNNNVDDVQVNKVSVNGISETESLFNNPITPNQICTSPKKSLNSIASRLESFSNSNWVSSAKIWNGKNNSGLIKKISNLNESQFYAEKGIVKKSKSENQKTGLGSLWDKDRGLFYGWMTLFSLLATVLILPLLFVSSGIELLALVIPLFFMLLSVVFFGLSLYHMKFKLRSVLQILLNIIVSILTLLIFYFTAFGGMA